MFHGKFAKRPDMQQTENASLRKATKHAKKKKKSVDQSNIAPQKAHRDVVTVRGLQRRPAIQTGHSPFSTNLS